MVGFLWCVLGLCPVHLCVLGPVLRAARGRFGLCSSRLAFGCSALFGFRSLLRTFPVVVSGLADQPGWGTGTRPLGLVTFAPERKRTARPHCAGPSPDTSKHRFASLDLGRQQLRQRVHRAFSGNGRFSSTAALCTRALPLHSVVGWRSRPLPGQRSGVGRPEGEPDTRRAATCACREVLPRG